MKQIYNEFLNNNFSFLWMLFATFGSIFLSLLLMPCVIKIAHKKKLMAIPCGRSSHKNAVPTLGGISIFISVTLITVLYSIVNNNVELMPLILALKILFFLGVNDDLMTISAKTKFIGQILVSALVIYITDLRIETWNGIFGVYELNNVFSFFITLFVFILVINAYNLIDGIDGLAGAIGVTVSAFFSFFFYYNNAIGLAVVSVSLLGALLVFIKFNLSTKNKIFMGDTGSMIVGFLLVFLSVKFLKTNYAIDANYKFNNPEIIVVALLFYPLIDTFRIFFVRKLIYKTSPFIADKNHIHHRILTINFKHFEVTKFICCTNLLVLFIAILTSNLEIHISLFAICLTGIIAISFPFVKQRYFQPYIRKII